MPISAELPPPVKQDRPDHSSLAGDRRRLRATCIPGRLLLSALPAGRRLTVCPVGLFPWPGARRGAHEPYMLNFGDGDKIVFNGKKAPHDFSELKHCVDFDDWLV